MRTTIAILTVALLAGCAGSPPKPPLPEGDYRPINVPAAAKPPMTGKLTFSPSEDTAKSGVFDFAYDGDITGALPALKLVAPEIHVMPTLGTPRPVHIHVDLKGTTLENALRTIGEQGGDVADVIWNTTKYQGGGQVLIRFRAPAQEDATKGESK